MEELSIQYKMRMKKGMELYLEGLNKWVDKPQTYLIKTQCIQ